MVVIGAQVADHLAGGQDPERLAAAAVVAGGHGPQVIARAQRRGAVLSGDPVDVLLPLRVHADHRRGLAVGPDDQVAHGQRADRPEAVRGEHGRVHGLRAAAHVRQGGDLDGARGHQPRDRIRVEHVVQRVVERAQVRVDLLVQGAGQEPQPLPRLHRRPGQDDPVDLLGLQRLDRLGHGQVGLPGARRADGEHDRVLVDRVRVALLVQRLGPDRPAAGGQDADGEHVGRPDAALGPQHGRGPLHRVGGQVRALAQQFDKLVEERCDQGGFRRGPGRGDLVAADVDVGVELPLNHVQQFVTGAEQADHRMISGYHDLHLRPRFALGPVFALPVAVGSAPGAQVIVSDICQFDALEDPEDRPPSVLQHHVIRDQACPGPRGPGRRCPGLGAAVIRVARRGTGRREGARGRAGRSGPRGRRC